MASPPPNTPPEIHFDEKWDRLIDTTLRRVVYGAAAGTLGALALCRGPVSRTFAVAFGAGWGAGSAWTTCSKDVRVFVCGGGLAAAPKKHCRCRAAQRSDRVQLSRQLSATALTPCAPTPHAPTQFAGLIPKPSE